MSNAKDFPNTVEFAAEKLYEMHNDKHCDGRYANKFSELKSFDKQYFVDYAETLLDAVNFFAFKTCKDCGYFDPIDKTCFGEDREHPEDPDKPICGTFCPPSLVQIEEVTTDE